MGARAHATRFSLRELHADGATAVTARPESMARHTDAHEHVTAVGTGERRNGNHTGTTSFHRRERPTAKSSSTVYGCDLSATDFTAPSG